jgi:hypothetical protein
MAEYDVVGKKNDLDDKRNMIVMFVVVGLLAAAAIGMLLVTPILARSNLPDIIGGDAKTEDCENL